MSIPKQSILFISGLDKSVNEVQLNKLFENYTLTYLKIAKDHLTKESYGYAFVGMKSSVKAEEALKELNYKKLGKKTIRIAWYNRDPTSVRNNPQYNIFVKKVAKTVTARQFHDYFSTFGNIISARLVEDDEGEVVGYGFVLYDSLESVDLAIKEANQKELMGKTIFVGRFIKNRPKTEPKFNNLFVKNIPIVTTLSRK